MVFEPKVCVEHFTQDNFMLKVDWFPLEQKQSDH